MRMQNAALCALSTALLRPHQPASALLATQRMPGQHARSHDAGGGGGFIPAVPWLLPPCTFVCLTCRGSWGSRSALQAGMQMNSSKQISTQRALPVRQHPWP